MNNNKYLEDLKNLKPLPPDRIPGGSPQSSVRSHKLNEVEAPARHSSINNQHSSINNQHSKEVTMEPLKSSKTLWGFGIALFIFILQSILAAANIAGPDNILVKTVIEVVIALAGFFGVYGIRDALRKIRSDL